MSPRSGKRNSLPETRGKGKQKKSEEFTKFQAKNNNKTPPATPPGGTASPIIGVAISNALANTEQQRVDQKSLSPTKISPKNSFLIPPTVAVVTTPVKNIVVQTPKDSFKPEVSVSVSKTSLVTTTLPIVLSPQSTPAQLLTPTLAPDPTSVPVSTPISSSTTPAVVTPLTVLVPENIIIAKDEMHSSDRETDRKSELYEEIKNIVKSAMKSSSKDKSKNQKLDFNDNLAEVIDKRIEHHIKGFTVKMEQAIAIQEARLAYTIRSTRTPVVSQSVNTNNHHFAEKLPKPISGILKALPKVSLVQVNFLLLLCIVIYLSCHV